MTSIGYPVRGVSFASGARSVHSRPVGRRPHECASVAADPFLWAPLYSRGLKGQKTNCWSILRWFFSAKLPFGQVQTQRECHAVWQCGLCKGAKKSVHVYRDILTPNRQLLEFWFRKIFDSTHRVLLTRICGKARAIYMWSKLFIFRGGVGLLTWHSKITECPRCHVVTIEEKRTLFKRTLCGGLP